MHRRAVVAIVIAFTLTVLGSGGMSQPTPVEAAAPTAIFDPVHGFPVFATSKFVSVTFSEQVTVLSASFAQVGQTEVDVTGNLATSNDVTFIYSATGLQIGNQYTFSVSAQNLSAEPSGLLSTTFSVEQAFQVPLVPGWNLISFPRQLLDSDLDAVFDSAPNVT